MSTQTQVFKCQTNRLLMQHSTSPAEGHPVWHFRIAHRMAFHQTYSQSCPCFSQCDQDWQIIPESTHQLRAGNAEAQVSVCSVCTSIRITLGDKSVKIWFLHPLVICLYLNSSSVYQIAGWTSQVLILTHDWGAVGQESLGLVFPIHKMRIIIHTLWHLKKS